MPTIAVTTDLSLMTGRKADGTPTNVLVNADGSLAIGASPTSATANNTSTTTNVAASATSIQVLAANTARKRLILSAVAGSALAHIRFGSTAATTTVYSFTLAAGATYEIADMGSAVQVIWAAATGSLNVTEISA